jgi:hypothetical protein
MEDTFASVGFSAMIEEESNQKDWGAGFASFK